ncbi:MAG: serine/threonine-protein kinase, partial [Gemmatimonas sp.]
MSPDFQFRLQHAIDANFQIDRELGGGGMSRVFLATERALQRRVVIKVLPPELAAGVNVERFRREIQLAAQLQHPHIVPLLATGDEDGILWFSMPFIEGESLRGALTKAKRLPARDVVRILHDVVDALAYAHARGIVHRDIKPDNILTSGMHALVTDFGVAKALSAAIPMAGGTSTGMAIGTPAYMAPEQLAADPAADHRVDIYAVGLLAYELLTGRSPFGGSSPQATMAAQLTETPKPPHQFADIPEGLSAVIMHCLEKDAAKRPQSAQALLTELEALPPMSSGSTLAARPATRRWARVAGVVAAVAVTLAVAQQIRNSPATPAADTLSARDAGPGGDRAPALQIAKNAANSTLRVKPETVVVYRNSTDSASGIQVPVVISRAESLAITAAVRQRIADAEAMKLASRPAPAASGAAKGVTTSSQTRVLVSDGPLTPLDREQLLI